MRPTANPSMRVFIPIWSGQLISLIGTGLTNFALGVWIYQQTGSISQFALIPLLLLLPNLLLRPLAGTLVDRLDRRMVMIACDLLAGLSTLTLVFLLATGQLALWHIYLLVVLRSLGDSFRWPALSASLVLIVPQQHLGRANGMMQIAWAASQIFPPLIAGVLIETINLQGVLLIDVISFLWAIIPVLLFRIPSPERAEQAEQRPLLRAAADGWEYITARPGLLRLLLLFTIVNFLLGLINVLVTPLVLSVASPAALGTVMTIGGLGMLAGAITMSVWGGPRRRIAGVLGFLALDGLCIALAGVQPLVPLFAVAAFGFFFGLAMINGCFWTVWQGRVAPDMQGRVFSIIQAIAQAATPLGYLAAGPLAERVFEPLLQPEGALAGSVGQLIGTGPGRGISLLFIALGIALVALAAWGYLQPRLRRLEDELPEVRAADPVTKVENEVPESGGAPVPT